MVKIISWFNNLTAYFRATINTFSYRIWTIPCYNSAYHLHLYKMLSELYSATTPHEWHLRPSLLWKFRFMLEYWDNRFLQTLVTMYEGTYIINPKYQTSGQNSLLFIPSQNCCVQHSPEKECFSSCTKLSPCYATHLSNILLHQLWADDSNEAGICSVCNSPCT